MADQGQDHWSSILELQREIGRLKQDIENLKSIVAAEVAAEAQKNSWGTWLSSPLYKKEKESEEVKARKDRERQERRVERDMKERRLESKKADLKTHEDGLKRGKYEVDAADLCDDRKIQLLWAMIQQEREKLERERIAKVRRQQQQQQQQQWEAAEAMRKEQAERRAAEQRRQQEEEARIRRAYTSSCRHDRWWSKVQGRTACPECYETWTYLLHCPDCQMKACPQCQAAIRGTMRRPRPQVRTRSPYLGYYWS